MNFEVSIYAYNDHIQFLNDILDNLKDNNVLYSQKEFGRDLGLTQPRISSILKGKEGISLKRAQEIAISLELSEHESQYLFHLVRSKSAKSIKEQEKSQEFINHHHNKKSYYQPLDSYTLLEMRGHDIIWNLITINSDFSDLQKIARIAKISVKEVNLIIEKFIELKLVERDFGKLVAKQEHISFGNALPSSAIRKFHKDKLKMALESIDEQGTDLRLNEAITFTVNKKDLPHLREKVEKFLDSFLEDIDENNQKDISTMCVSLFSVYDSADSNNIH